MIFFEEATLRLKQQLKVTEDKKAAEFLGLSPRAWAGRKKSENFPEKELYALAAKRPELNLDVDYVLTGITGEARDRLSAMQRHGTVAADAGLSFEDVRAYMLATQAKANSANLMGDLIKLLPGLTTPELEALFTLAQSLIQGRASRAGAMPISSSRPPPAAKNLLHVDTNQGQVAGKIVNRKP